MPDPMRMCAGCRERAPKKELIRVVRTPEGRLLLDAGAKASGRGAYICRKAECLKKARKNHALERMLNVEIPDQAYDELEQALNGGL